MVKKSYLGNVPNRIRWMAKHSCLPSIHLFYISYIHLILTPLPFNISPLISSVLHKYKS